MGSWLSTCCASLRSLWVPGARKARGRRANFRTARRQGFEPLEARLALASDVLPKMEISLALFEPNGAPLTQLEAGDDFVLKAFVRDLRPDAQGVFGAYTDVRWDSVLAEATGKPVHSTKYVSGKQGSASAGLLDEAGGFSGMSPLGAGSFELFSLPLRTTGIGTLLFTADPADNASLEMLLYGLNDEIPDEEIHYGAVSIDVAGTYRAVPDVFSILEDSPATAFAPLANDSPFGGQVSELSLQAVGTPSQGGAVSIGGDGKRVLYRPAVNFVGTEIFTYTAINQQGERRTTTVTMQVSDVNDPPMAVGDQYAVAPNSSRVLNVLANDLTDPDRGETLIITGVGSGSAGGMISIVGAELSYQPRPGFVGTETFTYMISERASGGLMAQGTVTINVNGLGAADDFYTLEEGQSLTLSPLENDIGADDAWIERVIIPQPDYGTLTIGSDRRTLVYTPSTQPFMSEIFGYEIRNSRGESQSGYIHLRITPAKAAPVAVPDKITLPSPTETAEIDVLGNDSPGSQPREDLRIVSVSVANPDVSIGISPDGLRLIYRGSAGIMRGAVEVNYVLSNGVTESSSAALTLSFAGQPEAPPGVSLTDGELLITGTAGDDRISVSVVQGRLRVSGKLAGEAVQEAFATREVQKIVAELGEGNDWLLVQANVKAALRADLGGGNDVAFAGFGPAVLVGGEGNDSLHGGRQRDVLIGGAGSDRLVGAGVNDLVIAGATPYDGDIAALDAIASEWGSRRSVAARRENLREGIGPVLEGQNIALAEFMTTRERIPGTLLPLAKKWRKA